MFAAAGLLPCLQVYMISWKMTWDLISESEKGVFFCIYLTAMQWLTLFLIFCRGMASHGAYQALVKGSWSSAGHCHCLLCLTFEWIEAPSWDSLGQYNRKRATKGGWQGTVEWELLGSAETILLWLEVTLSVCTVDSHELHVCLHYPQPPHFQFAWGRKQFPRKLACARQWYSKGTAAF